MKIRTQRLNAGAMIVVGLTVPYIIDAYETANHLDIKRDVGVLIWWILAGLGAGWMVWTFLRRKG